LYSQADGTLSSSSANGGRGGWSKKTSQKIAALSPREPRCSAEDPKPSAELLAQGTTHDPQSGLPALSPSRISSERGPLFLLDDFLGIERLRLISMDLHRV